MTTEKLETIITGPIKTQDATLTIEMPGQRLSIGRHTFQLQVADDSGNVSAPATVMVIVADTEAPTAILVARDAQGQLLDANTRLSLGSGFILDGRKSLDIGGGKIVSYTWTLAD